MVQYVRALQFIFVEQHSNQHYDYTDYIMSHINGAVFMAHSVYRKTLNPAVNNTQRLATSKLHNVERPIVRVHVTTLIYAAYKISVLKSH